MATCNKSSPAQFGEERFFKPRDRKRVKLHGAKYLRGPQRRAAPSGAPRLQSRVFCLPIWYVFRDTPMVLFGDWLPNKYPLSGSFLGNRMNYAKHIQTLIPFPVPFWAAERHKTYVRLFRGSSTSLFGNHQPTASFEGDIQ